MSDAETFARSRAAAVAACVQREQDRGRRAQEAFHDEARQLMAAIEIYGLGQALASLLSRGGKPRSSHPARRLHDELEQWLHHTEVLTAFRGDASILDTIMRCEQDVYLRAHFEAAAWLEELTAQLEELTSKTPATTGA